MCAFQVISRGGSICSLVHGSWHITVYFQTVIVILVHHFSTSPSIGTLLNYVLSINDCTDSNDCKWIAVGFVICVFITADRGPFLRPSTIQELIYVVPCFLLVGKSSFLSDHIFDYSELQEVH